MDAKLRMRRTPFWVRRRASRALPLSTGRAGGGAARFQDGRLRAGAQGGELDAPGDQGQPLFGQVGAPAPARLKNRGVAGQSFAHRRHGVSGVREAGFQVLRGLITPLTVERRGVGQGVGGHRVRRMVAHGYGQGDELERENLGHFPLMQLRAQLHQRQPPFPARPAAQQYQDARAIRFDGLAAKRRQVHQPQHARVQDEHRPEERLRRRQEQHSGGGRQVNCRPGQDHGHGSPGQAVGSRRDQIDPATGPSAGTRARPAIERNARRRLELNPPDSDGVNLESHSAAHDQVRGLVNSRCRDECCNYGSHNHGRPPQRQPPRQPRHDGREPRLAQPPLPGATAAGTRAGPSPGQSAFLAHASGRSPELAAGPAGREWGWN